MTTPAESVVWLRAEFQGREDELVHLSAAAALVGVTRSTVSNWAKRHANFPKIALLMGIGAGRAKYVPRNEFLDFAYAQLNKERGTARKTGPHRPTAVIRSEEIAHHERQIIRLADLETRQAKALASTRRALRTHRARLGQVRQRLEAEVAAIRGLELTDAGSAASPDASGSSV
jgi:transcriptional regulator with XRE-family HTH domain